MSVRYTVILVPDQDGWISASVPAMPGCVSQGKSREEALAHVLEAMRGWMDVEADAGRQPLDETPELVAAGVNDSLELIDEMVEAGEASREHGYQLELTSVEVGQPAAA